jgi:autotransporter-associated beta strand protein
MAARQAMQALATSSSMRRARHCRSTAAGTPNAPFTNPAFAVLAGAAGTVTVDNSLGQVTASGMQFASNGYQLTGGEIALSGSQASVIRVGDGTAAGASVVATINNVLSGNTQLIKTDAGTLDLAGVNAYTGVTAIQDGGTLRISQEEPIPQAASRPISQCPAANKARLPSSRATLAATRVMKLPEMRSKLLMAYPSVRRLCCRRID